MKKILFTCLIVCFLLYACFYPELILEASKSGIMIWFEQILPTLLPFTILSYIFLNSHFLEDYHGNSNLLACGITMICGFLFGFPIGAKLSSDFYKNNMLTKNQATMLSITTNNFSPMFVCGFVLPTLFKNNYYRMISYLLLYLLPLCLAVIYLILKCQVSSNKLKEIHKSQTSSFNVNIHIVDEGIIQGFTTLIKLCGYIVIFSILSSICVQIFDAKSFLSRLFLLNLEISNGISILNNLNLDNSTTYILAIQMLSLGGLSGIVQSASLLESSGLSTHKYIIGKVILSLLLTLLSIMYVSNFILQP